MGMIPWLSSRFPDSLVRRIPMLDHVVSKPDQRLLHLAIQLAAVKCELGGGIHDLSINIKLQLIASRVADAHRPGAAISPQNFRLALLGWAISVKGVNNP